MSTAFDRIPADRYDETRGGDERGDRLVADLRPWFVPGVALEVGVGTGVMAGALSRAGWPVFGVDLALPMLAKAYGRIGGRVAAADAGALPFAARSVDNVLFCWVLHLVDDIGAAFREAARVLRPGGRVLAVINGPMVRGDDLDPGLAMLRALSRRSDTAPVLDRAAAAAGLRPVCEGLTSPRELSVSPATLIRYTEERIWSYLWNCTDEEWAAHAVPAIAAFRALPDQDRPRSSPARQAYRVYESRPGGAT